jgi:hypothetical protein
VEKNKDGDEATYHLLFFFSFLYLPSYVFVVHVLREKYCIHLLDKIHFVFPYFYMHIFSKIIKRICFNVLISNIDSQVGY